MDPVQQTLAQQSSGSAEGQGFGQFYVQGVQARQEDKRINLAQQRLDLERQQEARAKKHDDLLDPLHAKLMDAQARNLGITAVERQQAVDLEAMRRAFIPEVQDLEMDFLASPLGGADPELRSRARQLFDQNPAAKHSEAGVSVMQIIKGAVANRGEFNEIEEAYARFGNKLGSYNPKTGATTFRDPEEMALKRQRLAQATTRLQQQADDMLRKKDAQGLARVRYQLDVVKAQQNALEAGFNIEGVPELPEEVFNPGVTSPAQSAASTLAAPIGELGPSTITPPAPTNTPPVAPTLRRVERPLTTGALKDFQEQSVAADVSLRELADIRSEIQKHPNAFGPVGEFGKWKEFAFGLFNPKADATVTRIRQKAGQTFVTIARSLRPDTGNMSRFELERLRTLGDLTALENVPSVALGKADELISLQVAKKLRIAKELNKGLKDPVPVPDMVLRAIAPDDVKGLFDDGLLAPADVVRTVNMMPAAEAEALKKALLNGR